MIFGQNLDYLVALPPQSVATASVTTAAIDTKNFHYLSLALLSAAASAATAPTVLKVTECDTSGGTYTNVPGTVGGTDYTIPAGSTAAAGYVYAIFNLDTRRRKRFIKLTITNATTQILSVLALLTRGDATPVGTTTPANMGVTGIVVNA